MIRLYTEVGKEHVHALDMLVEALRQKSVGTVHSELNRIAEENGRDPVIENIEIIDSSRVYCARLLYSDEQVDRNSCAKEIPERAFFPIDVEMSNMDPQDWTRTTPMIPADLVDTLADHRFIDVDLFDSGLTHYPIDGNILDTTGEVRVLQDRDLPVMLLCIVTLRARGRKLLKSFFARCILGQFPLKVNKGIAVAGILLAVLGGLRSAWDIGSLIVDVCTACVFEFISALMDNI